MLLDVVEGVLRDVGVTHVGVTPDGTDVGLSLAGEELNEGGLTGTVGAEARDAGGERELDGGARDDLAVGVGVGEVAVVRLDDSLVLVLDTLEETGDGEDELELVVGELGVLLRRGALADELGEVTLVGHQLAGLVVDDVSAHAVEETGIVGHNHGRDGGLGDEVILEPRDVLHVEVVGGLIEEENVRLHEDGAREGELHLPATGESHDGALDHALGELEGEEGTLHILRGDTVGLDDFVVEDKLDDGHLVLVALDVVLDVHGAELIGRGNRQPGRC